MKWFFGSAFGISICFAAGFALAATTEGKQRHAEGHGIRIAYPATWYFSGGQEETLFFYLISGLRDPKTRGVRISEGQAEVIIAELDSKLEDRAIIADLSRDESIISRRYLTLNEPAGRKCGKSLEIVSIDPAGPTSAVDGVPPTYFSNTRICCRIRDRWFRIMLSYWKGDRKHYQFEHVFLGIAQSLELAH